MSASIIDGKAIAQAIRDEIALGVAKLKAATGITPGLAAVLVGIGWRSVFVWLGLIGASTVLVHQHHLLDVAAALMLVWALRRYFTIDNALILGDKPDA